MFRRVYISCEYNERELAEVKALRDFLRTSNCVVEFAPGPDWPGYRLLEETIERCDAFVAVMCTGYGGATWLNHELHYAYALYRARMRPRPRLFALRIEGHPVPGSSESIPLEWLDENNRELLLADLIERAK